MAAASPSQLEAPGNDESMLSGRPNDDHDDGDPTERRRFLRTSQEQKELLITLVQVDGRSIREAAQIVGINESTARNIVSAFRREGAIVHRRRGGSNALKLTPEALQRIEDSVERHPDDTLLQTQQRLREQGINLAVSSVYNALVRLKVTLKKRRYEFDLENSAATVLGRQFYALDFSAHAPQNIQKWVFIDQCGFNLHLPRTQAARSNEENHPIVRGRMVTLILAMNSQGVLHARLVDDGACNGPTFRAFVEEFVAGTRGVEELNGAWLIMDSASIHDMEQVRRVVDGTAFQMRLLPPCAHMLNPAENVFSKVKASARCLLTNPTTELTLSAVIQNSLSTVNQEDCGSYVLNMMVNLANAAAGRPFDV